MIHGISMKLAKVVGISLLILICLIFSAIGIALNFIFTPKKITPAITTLLNENMQARVHLEAVELTFFSTFPNFGLKLRNGSLISQAAYIHPTDTTDPTDSLLAFRECRVTVNPIAYLLKKEIIIHEIRMTDPVVHAFIDSAGQANWEVISSEKDTADSSKPGDTTTKQIGLAIDIKKVAIRNGKLTFSDRRTDLDVGLQEFNFRLKGALRERTSDLKVGFSAKDIRCMQQRQVLTNGISLGCEMDLGFDSGLNRVDVNQASITLNSLGFTARGYLMEDTLTQAVNVDLDIGLRVTSLKDLLRLLPSGVVVQNASVKANGEVIVDATIRGVYGQEQIPLITGTILIKDGSAKYDRLPGSIDRLDADIAFLLDASKKQSSWLDVRNLLVHCGSSQVEVTGKLSDLLSDPVLEAGVNLQVNFTELTEIFPLEEGVILKGMLRSNMAVHFRFSDLARKDYGKLDFTGETEMNDVNIESSKDTFLFAMNQAHLDLGIEHTDTSFPDQLNLLRGSVTLDGMKLLAQEELRVFLEQCDLRFTTSEPKDTLGIAPMTATAGIQNLVAELGDTLMLKAGKVDAAFRVIPSSTDPALGIISGSLSIDTLTTEALTSVARLDQPSIDLTTRPGKAGEDEWVTSGSLGFSRLVAFTPLFPLPVQFDRAMLRFSPGEFFLENVSARVGNSDLILTGRLHLPSLSGNPADKLQASLRLESDLIDLNELADAMDKGNRYAEEQGGKEKNQITVLSIDSVAGTESKQAQQDKPTTFSSFMVPRDIDLAFDTRIRKVVFNELVLDSVRGRVAIRDQSVDLRELSMSNHGATLRTSLLYRTATRDTIYIGLDLDITDIDLGILTDMTPTLDTLLPMLNSLEGKVDFRMAVEATLDTNLTIILNTLRGAASLKADSLVVLDGENFGKIAKMFYFKNKQRNLIDGISAEILLSDGFVEVFPFLLQADVYKVAVGGVQNLDLSFHYHVSLLAPLRISMDITGTPEKMKFDLVKSRYREMFVPSRKGVVDSSALLIRKKIREELTRY